MSGGSPRTDIGHSEDLGRVRLSSGTVDSPGDAHGATLGAQRMAVNVLFLGQSARETGDGKKTVMPLGDGCPRERPEVRGAGGG